MEKDDKSKTSVPLKARWDKLHGEKTDILSRCEQYAQWTLPYLFPPVGVTGQLARSADALGAKGVNHMANKVVSTLFRQQGSFFRMHVGKKARKTLTALLPPETDAVAIAAEFAKIDAALNDAEQECIEYLDMVSYRPMAINAAKLLIVTGNALVYHPEGKPVQVYGLRNYSLVRDISGAVLEIITKESKAFETFPTAVQEQLRASRTVAYEDRSNVDVFTKIALAEDGKYHVTQAADMVDISTPDACWPRETLPWIPITWNLVNGEDYGRGLVEDFAGAFHAISVLSQSLLNLAGIMGDIKFLVAPTSNIDVVALNNSPAGTYHSGKTDEVAAIQTNKQSDAQFIAQSIDRYEKQIAQAFMLNSALTRDAERVTAEEIRMQANELDTSQGGVYSRLAHQWQTPTAHISLDHTKFPAASFGVTVQIITGMDSLSRQGELDNLRQFIGDMALLEAVPEDFRTAINPLKYAAVCGKARQVDYEAFMYTAAEMQQKQEQAMLEAGRMEQQKAAGAVATEAGKAAVQAPQQG